MSNKSQKIYKYDISKLTEILNFLKKSPNTKRTKQSWIKKKIKAVILKIGNKIIGIIPFENVIDIQKNRIAWITGAYVSNKFQGQGFGSIILDSFKKLYKNYDYIFALPGQINGKAAKWYIKNKFKVLIYIYSLEIKKFKLTKFVNYSVAKNNIEIKKNTSSFINIHKNFNKSFYCFPVRNYSYWNNQINYHYYKKYYKFYFIYLKKNNKIISYALVGITSIKDKIKRIDILEIACDRTYKFFNNTIFAVYNFAFKNNINVIRIQVTKNDMMKHFLFKLGFKIRWKTYLLYRNLNGTNLNKKFVRFFGIDYI